MKCLSKCRNFTKAPLPWKISGCAPETLGKVVSLLSKITRNSLHHGWFPANVFQSVYFSEYFLVTTSFTRDFLVYQVLQEINLFLGVFIKHIFKKKAKQKWFLSCSSYCGTQRFGLNLKYTLFDETEAFKDIRRKEGAPTLVRRDSCMFQETIHIS